MNRRERRRYAKQIATGQIKVNEGKRKEEIVVTQLVDYHGKKYNNLRDYLEAHEKDTAREIANIASEMLY